MAEPRVYVIHARGEEEQAEVLARPLREAGYEVDHDGTVLVGESLVDSAMRAITNNSAIVLCATVKAVGSKWAHQVVKASYSNGRTRVFAVLMDQDAYVDQLALQTKVAHYCDDPAVAMEQLLAALAKHFPRRTAGPSPHNEPHLHPLDAPAGEFELDVDAVARFRGSMRPEAIETYPPVLSVWEFFDRTGLRQNGSFTKASVLLFGKNPTSVFPTAMVKCVRYVGLDRASVREMKDFSGTVPEQIEAALAFVAQHAHRGERPSPDQARSVDEHDYPMIAVRELIANALVHRDYLDSRSNVHVRMFRDRMEISSPGSWIGRQLPDGTPCSLADLEGHSIKRNFRLARILSLARLVEGEGSGIPTSLQDCRHAGAEPPTVSCEQGLVTVTVQPRPPDGGAVTAPGRVVPRQLPAAPALIGRTEELAALSRALDEGHDTAGIVTIVGSAGIGKTALALSWAHQHSGRYPDGQLYVDLHGVEADADPSEPVDVVGELLRALGLEESRIPAADDARYALFRSVLSDKRILLVLDDAQGEWQVLRLLPGGSSCAVLITSRFELGELVGLHHARRVALGPLSPDEARAALTTRLGVERVALEEPAFEDMLAACRGIPAALVSLAARAQHSSSLSLAALAEELRWPAPKQRSRRDAARVFISFTGESDGHVQVVQDFWIFLRGNGIDATVELPEKGPSWAADQIRTADHVLVVASAAYREQGAELISDAFLADPRGQDRFVPVVLPGQSIEGVPDFLAPALTTVYHVTDFTPAGADPLLRLLGQPADGVPLPHDVELHVAADPSGAQTMILLAGSVLGRRISTLPVGLAAWQAELDSPSGTDRLTVLGHELWQALVDEPTGRRLVELINRGPVGTVVNVVAHLAPELAWLPVELLRLPDGRLAATVPGVRFTRRLTGVERVPAAPLPGPLKILAAVAAPDETKTASPPSDVEAEMQALLDATADLDPGASAEVQLRILEVASPAEIGRALAEDDYHVLHLSAHGATDVMELEDEDGYPVTVGVADLAATLRTGEKPVPLVVLSGIAGTELAAALVRHGADRVIAMQTAVTERFAIDLARELYHHLAADPKTAVAQALAAARRDVRTQAEELGQQTGRAPRPEFAVPTLLCGGVDMPLRDASLQEAPLRRPTVQAVRRGVGELPIGHLIGRRAAVRTAMAVLRGSTTDRERFGDRAGVVLTGIGGIGKTAVAGRILARAREHGWLVAEHVGLWNPAALIRSVADALTDSPLITALRDKEKSDAEKLSVIVRALAEVRLLVLFDDFEQNLTPEGEFSDAGFAEIFGAFCDAAQAGRLLVTCRHPVPAAEDALLRIELPALSAAELGRLFLRLPALRGLSPEDRQLVFRTIGGHPRLIEFLDVLLRNGTITSFRHVAGALRRLAAAEQIDLRPSRDLATGLAEVVRLGSRDILLDSLTAQLTAPQLELLLQAALSRASFTVTDLARTRHGAEHYPDELTVVARDVERLRDLSLLSVTANDELEVHPWVAASLQRHQNSDVVARHRRGAAMRMHRIRSGRVRFDDLADLVHHLAGSRNYDDAVTAALEACELVGGEAGAAALLAEAVPLVPVDHPGYLVLADRERAALQAIGLTTATTHRLQHILTITAERATADPADPVYQRDLSISHDRLGDLAVAMGDTATAEQHYRAALTIRSQLAGTDPTNAGYQRDLSTSHNKLGSLSVAVGDVATAAHHYRSGLAIQEQLVVADPTDTGCQRDLSISHNNLGDLAVTIGDTTTAEQHYRAGLAIRSQLADTDPDNAAYQRDLSISHNNLGDLLASAGDTSAAEHHFRVGLALAERLAAADPGNAKYQRYLSISHEGLGELAVAIGDTLTAERHFHAGLDLAERLAAADPDNAGYQRDLSISHNRLGDLAETVGRATSAEEHYRAALAIRERLAATDPDNAAYQRDLSISHNRLGDLAETVGRATSAEKHYRAALAIRERLAATDPDNAAYQRDLSISRQRLNELSP